MILLLQCFLQWMAMQQEVAFMYEKALKLKPPDEDDEDNDIKLTIE